MSNHPPRLSTLSRSIRDRVVLVTGAASGMGRATAELLADEGAAVGLVDRDAQGLDDVVGRLRSAGARVHAVAADLSDPEAAATVVGDVRERLGPLDGLVNNAGVAVPVGIEDPAFDEVWATSLAVNLTAQARLVRAALDDLARDAGGRVVNVASTEGLGATSGHLPYTVAKHGVVGLTRSLAVELGARGVTVNCVCPGPIATAMTALIPDEAKRTFARRRTALLRYGEPEEVAHITLALLLPSASYITGAVIPVDGGLTARSG